MPFTFFLLIPRSFGSLHLYQFSWPLCWKHVKHQLPRNRSSSCSTCRTWRHYSWRNTGNTTIAATSVLLCNDICKPTDSDTNFCLYLPWQCSTPYPKHATCVVPVNLCSTYPNQCQCTGMHTQLVDYEHILVVNTATTPAGKLVSTLAGYSKATNEHQTAYRLRDTYAEQGETYKEIRSRLYGPYLM